jgi:hypothetical protein
MTGLVIGSGRAMAGHAIRNSSIKAALILIEGIKDRPEFRIGHGHFQQVTPRNVTDVNIVIEVQRSGTGGRNQFTLQARFGKNQGLRVRINPKIPQQETQITGTLFPGPLNVIPVKFPL